MVFPVSRVCLSEAGSLLGEPRARSEPGALNMTAAKERRRPEGSQWAGEVGRLEELGRSCVFMSGPHNRYRELRAANTRRCGSGLQAQLRCVPAPGLAAGCSPGFGWAALSSRGSAGEAGSRLSEVTAGVGFLAAEGSRLSLHHHCAWRPCSGPPPGSIRGHSPARPFISARPWGGSVSLHLLRQSLA